MASPRINFESDAAEIELTKEECEAECVREDGFLEVVYAANKPYTPDNIKGCIQELQEYKYATCGVIKQTTEEKSQNAMKALRKFGYIEFVLRRQRINDPASECELEGWQQGADDSDCWIDSFLFAIFANNNLSHVLIHSLHKKYHETEEKSTESDTALNNALFSINLYLNLLTNRAKAMKQKGTIKWCIVWYILQYFKLTKSYDEYDSFRSKASLQELTLTIGQGGDPNLLSCFLSEVDRTYTSSVDTKTFTNLAEIKEGIRDVYTKSLTSNFIAVPFTITRETDTTSRYYPELLNLFTHKVFLEAVVIGKSGHATSFTFCNNNWRDYDNKRTPKTTTMISRQDFGNKLNMLLKNKVQIPTFILLVYRISSQSVKGGTRKQRRKGKHSKKHQTKRR